MKNALPKDRQGRTPEKNTEELAASLRSSGVDTFGFADMTGYDIDLVGIENNLKERLPYAVVFAVALSGGVMETIAGGPNQLYLHHYRQLNYRLDTTAYTIGREIEKQGFSAVPFAASQVVDWRKQSGHISHKKVGLLAGLGWIGRNNLLVDPTYGSHMRYNTVLTDLPLVTGTPIRRDCGSCTACVTSCPAKAIKEEVSAFDHKGCYEMIDKLRKERNIGHHICGICVAACKGVR